MKISGDRFKNPSHGRWRLDDIDVARHNSIYGDEFIVWWKGMHRSVLLPCYPMTLEQWEKNILRPICADFKRSLAFKHQTALLENTDGGLVP